MTGGFVFAGRMSCAPSTTTTSPSRIFGSSFFMITSYKKTALVGKALARRR